MHLHCLGINHTTAPLALRECLSFSPHQLDAALARLGCGTEARWADIQECVILSTCNRVEVYALTTKDGHAALLDFLSDVQGVSAEEIAPIAYQLEDDEVVSHLLRVAAGLESMVLGEPQILGQVTEAYSTARRHGTTGKILSRLFQTAIRGGKRTRTETAISHNPSSISSVAVNLIARTIQDLRTANILVIGAGVMAELAVEALRKRGAVHFTIANRTLENAGELARRWDGRAATLEALPALLAQADIVLSSTSAPHTIITRSLLESARRGSQNRPLVLMDIAVPRDVDADVETLPNIQRFDIDDLNTRLEGSLSLRQAEIPAVEQILAEEHQAFFDYLITLDVVPIITDLRSQADAIRLAELEKTLRRMPELPPEVRLQLELLTKSIVKKILHTPTIRLREVAGASSAAEYTEVARSLFGLD